MGKPTSHMTLRLGMCIIGISVLGSSHPFIFSDVKTSHKCHLIPKLATLRTRYLSHYLRTSKPATLSTSSKPSFLSRSVNASN